MRVCLQFSCYYSEIPLYIQDLSYNGTTLIKKIPWKYYFVLSINWLFYILGSGYAELLSYCTCDEDTNTPFALCDKRAGICSSKQGNYPPSDTSKLGKIKGFYHSMHRLDSKT